MNKKFAREIRERARKKEENIKIKERNSGTAEIVFVFLLFRSNSFFRIFRVFRGQIIFSLIIGAAIFGTLACQPNQSILKSGSSENSDGAATNANAPIAYEPESFETGLRGVRSGNYIFVTAFRRKDGAAFDKDDRKFIKAIIPSETNQIVLTDGDRAVITGSNFVFPPEILSILRERFTVEDFSEKKNDNANAANNANQ